MSTGLHTQATQTLVLIDQKGPTKEHLKKLHDGYLSDALDAIMGGTMPDRETFRKTLGLPSLLPPPPPEPVVIPEDFRLIVDYELTLQDMIKAGRYDWVNDDITPKRFPLKGKGKQEVDAKLIHFGRDISSENAIAELDKMGLRRATIEELLAFGAANPEIQRQFPIVALGSVCEVRGDRDVACLYGFGPGRRLRLGLWGGGWVGGCRFLAVRK